MFLKIIGCAAVLLSSTFTGYMLSRQCSKRPQDLRDLQSMLYMLENEIGCLVNVLPDAFEKISRCRKNSSVSVIFGQTSEFLREKGSCTASQAWDRAVTENIAGTALNEEDKEILLSFGKMLGNSGLEGQIKNIRLTIKQLEVQEKKAEAVRLKNERMYRSLGVLGGLAIVLVFI